MRGLWVIQKLIGEKMKKLYFILILNVFYIFGFSINSFAEDSEKILEFSLPEASNPLQTNRYYCKDIVGSLIEAVTENMKILPSLKKGVRGEVFKGTDVFSVKIDKDKLYLKTKLEFEMGDVGGSIPFSIIHNDDDNVVAIAIDTSNINMYVGVFYLNKNNGIGIWQKTQSHTFFYSRPRAQSICFKCISR